MSLAQNEFVKAVYTRLAAQVTTVPTYDYVPKSAAFPYIRLGTLTSIADDTKTRDAQEFTITIHIYSQNAGRKTTSAIMESVYTALHLQHANISMTGFNCVFIRCEYSQSDVEPTVEGNNDHYQHGVLRFRALITTN